jgi:transposase
VSKSAELAVRERTRRRSWPASLKKQIVAETLEPGASASVVARRHDVNANLVFNWRRLQRKAVPVAKTAPAARLVPVRVSAESAAVGGSTVGELPSGVIEIELPSGVRGAVGLATLRQVLDLVRGNRGVTAAWRGDGICETCSRS